MAGAPQTFPVGKCSHRKFDYDLCREVRVVLPVDPERGWHGTRGRGRERQIELELVVVLQRFSGREEESKPKAAVCVTADEKKSTCHLRRASNKSRQSLGCTIDLDRYGRSEVQV